MSTDIRLASGDITAYDLLTNDSYLVTNFTRQPDMQAGTVWLATQIDLPALQQYRPSLERGAGKLYGQFAAVIEFLKFTEGMRQYIDTTILGGNPEGVVTLTLNHPTFGFSVFTGQLVTPYVANSSGSFTRYDNRYYYNNQYVFERGTRKTVSYLLLESGDTLLAENGDLIALEQQ